MVDADAISPSPDSELASRSESLSQDILRRGPQEAAIILARESEDTIATVLTLLPTAKAVALLPRFEAARRFSRLSHPSSASSGSRMNSIRREVLGA